MIIAGMTRGEKKLNFEIFMEPIVNELKKLEMGIIYDQTKIKCFTLFVVYDKSARADILNIINSTGYITVV
jgi:hypothetical protein